MAGDLGGKRWPETIGEAVDVLLVAITEESKVGIMRMAEVDLPLLHSTSWRSSLALPPYLSPVNTRFSDQETLTSDKRRKEMSGPDLEAASK
jgi:hypothetical protein